jgi:hypothetical protein
MIALDRLPNRLQKPLPRRSRPYIHMDAFGTADDGQCVPRGQGAGPSWAPPCLRVKAGDQARLRGRKANPALGDFSYLEVVKPLDPSDLKNFRCPGCFPRSLDHQLEFTRLITVAGISWCSGCNQERLVCSAGDRPARVKVRAL